MKRYFRLTVMVLLLAMALGTAAYAEYQPKAAPERVCAGFADADGDGVCDSCGVACADCPGFTDGDGDGICDRQGQRRGAGTGFTDGDGDGVCDSRGTRGGCRGCGRGRAA